MALSSEKLEKLAAEIATVSKDHATITAALIQAAKTEKKLGEDIEDIADRLEGLKQQEEGIRHSLAARRDVLAEVLGALQRMGLNPPPAMLVKPEDALSSVRSAILLGAVVPELRSETEILLADLKELYACHRLDRGRARAAGGSRRRADRRKAAAQPAARRKAAAAGRDRSRARPEHATLGRTGRQGRQPEGPDRVAGKGDRGARSAQEKARAPQAEQAKARGGACGDAGSGEQPPGRNRAVFAHCRASSRCLWQAVSRGDSAHDDGNGGVMLGDMVATQSGAIVTAPADGSVLYAGPFRSYGQLLILNAGDGYHVVLAGMGRISVAQGQSVLAGEPVGAMGEARVASTSASGIGNAGPELYVEFRKDGKPVDPAPWWAVRLSGRTGNDT